MTNFTATIEEAEKNAVASGYTTFQGKYIPYAKLKQAIDNDAERAGFELAPKRHTSISIPEPDVQYEFIDTLESAVRSGPTAPLRDSMLLGTLPKQP
jgi:hypothetical protein